MGVQCTLENHDYKRGTGGAVRPYQVLQDNAIIVEDADGFMLKAVTAMYHGSDGQYSCETTPSIPAGPREGSAGGCAGDIGMLPNGAAGAPTAVCNLVDVKDPAEASLVKKFHYLFRHIDDVHGPLLEHKLVPRRSVRCPFYALSQRQMVHIGVNVQAISLPVGF